MKAIVVEKQGNYAIVLDKEGCFKRIKINSKVLNVGDEIEINERAIKKEALRILAAAASFIIFFGVAFSGYAYFTPYSYVDVDINPSVEIVANRFDRVLKVDAVNVDGEKLLFTSFKHQKLSEAVVSICNKAEEVGYLKKGEENNLLLTFSSKRDAKADILESELTQIVQSSSNETKVMSEKVSIQEHDNARELGLSAGKLLLLDKLKEANPDINTDMYTDVSIKEIMESIKDLEKKSSEKKNKEESKDKKDDDSDKTQGNNKEEKDKDRDIIRQKEEVKNLENSTPKDKEGEGSKNQSSNDIKDDVKKHQEDDNTKNKQNIDKNDDNDKDDDDKDDDNDDDEDKPLNNKDEENKGTLKKNYNSTPKK